MCRPQGAAGTESGKLFRLRALHNPAGANAPTLRVPRARPWRALRPRRAGRWPAVGPGPAGLLGTVPHGRGKRGSRFLIPPALAKALPPLQWQGPSPLPQRHAGSCPAGGQSPRPAPAPPTAGASRPPGRALAFRGAWTRRSTGHRRAGAGETRVAFPVPARTGEGTFTAALAGAIAPATAPR